MSQQLLSRIYQGDRYEALDRINTIYQDQGYCVVSYVYGAVIIRHRLLHDNLTTPRQQALSGSDMILPDGAALKTYWKVAHYLGKVKGVSHLHNLNGTDFFPFLLEQYLQKGPVNLVCYAVYDESIGLKQGRLLDQSNKYLLSRYGISRTYAQDTHYSNNDMSDRNRDAMSQSCDPALPTLMMVCRGVPRQELWSYYHRDQLKRYRVIACNQGATIDYRAGREIRAHPLVRALRLESLRRLVSDPRKNRSKFWVSFKMMWEIGLLIRQWLVSQVK